MATGEKTGGRQKGTPNKLNAEIRERFKQLVDNNLEGLQSDLESLKPSDRVKFIIELAKFVVPTLKAVDITSEEKPIRPIIIDLGAGINPEDDE